jgi:hypothetical protein
VGGEDEMCAQTANAHRACWTHACVLACLLTYLNLNFDEHAASC